jgi:hypothetical protein
MAFGYRYGEVPLPPLLPIKDGTSISKARPVNLRKRPVVQASLNCHAVGVAMPHPDPVDPDTMRAGVQKRFAFAPPEPDRALLRRLRLFVRSWVRKNLVPLSPDADTSFESWIKKTRYPEARKAELREKWKAVTSIRDPSKRYFACKSFMKDETYPDYKHARGINSRSDEFKCYVGPIFKLIEEVVYKLKEFIKHVPVADRPQYIKDMIYRVGSKYVATDYTAFESLFTAELMEACEFELYEYMVQELPEAEEFMSVLRDVLAGENVCEFKHFTVKVPATRMSGEMCTSLGNGFSNLMFMLFLCHELGSTAIGCVEGDDGLFRVEGDIPSTESFARLGLVIKLEEHTDLCAASFCGMIFDPEDLVNVTNPLEVLASLGWTTNKYFRSRRGIKMSLLRCKALSYAHQYPGSPIISVMADYVLRVTHHVKDENLRVFVSEKWRTNLWEREQLLDVLGHNIPRKPIGVRTRLLVESKFGIPIETQFSIENYLKSLFVLQPLSIPLMDLMAPLSWSDYWTRYVITGKDTLEERDLWCNYSGFKKEW